MPENSKFVPPRRAEMKDVVRQNIETYAMEWLRDREAFYPTIGAAVAAYLAETGDPAP